MGSRIFELYRRAAMGNGGTGRALMLEITKDSDISPGMKTISKSAAFNPPMGTQGKRRQYDICKNRKRFGGLPAAE